MLISKEKLCLVTQLSENELGNNLYNKGDCACAPVLWCLVAGPSPRGASPGMVPWASGLKLGREMGDPPWYYECICLGWAGVHSVGSEFGGDLEFTVGQKLVGWFKICCGF